MYSEAPKAKRIEFRCPDAAANPYLAFSAMLMAGIDGIERGLDPGAPADYDLFEESHGEVPQVPSSLGEALDALEADHEFRTRAGVFSEELIRTWLEYKRENEGRVVRLRPHPAGSGSTSMLVLAAQKDNPASSVGVEGSTPEVIEHSTADWVGPEAAHAESSHLRHRDIVPAGQVRGTVPRAAVTRGGSEVVA